MFRINIVIVYEKDIKIIDEVKYIFKKLEKNVLKIDDFCRYFSFVCDMLY